MTFRDKSFCASDCSNTGCDRNWNAETKRDAERWWAGCKGPPPVAMSDLRTGCRDYVGRLEA